MVIMLAPAIVSWAGTGAANIDGCRSKKRTGETAQMTAGVRRNSRMKCVPLRVDLLTDSRSSRLPRRPRLRSRSASRSATLSAGCIGMQRDHV